MPAEHTPASDDREETQWERPTRLLCLANASVNADHIEAPEHRPKRAYAVAGYDARSPAEADNCVPANDLRERAGLLSGGHPEGST